MLGLVALGCSPTAEQLAQLSGGGARSAPLLFIGGSQDGVVRASTFAVAMEQARVKRYNKARFAVIDGASHHSFASGPMPATVASMDLQPATEDTNVHVTVGVLVRELLEIAGRWTSTPPSSAVGAGSLAQAEAAAARMAAPLVAALRLEGSAALGVPVCNSDFPTNPQCQYPQWPAHSGPPGPRPAPNPLPPTNCICGSPWVEEYGAAMVLDVGSKVPNASASTHHF
jgi:hypothetical protein